MHRKEFLHGYVRTKLFSHLWKHTLEFKFERRRAESTPSLALSPSSFFTSGVLRACRPHRPACGRSGAARTASHCRREAAPIPLRGRRHRVNGVLGRGAALLNSTRRVTRVKASEARRHGRRRRAQVYPDAFDRRH